MAGCTCAAISNHEWIGHCPPTINHPQDIACQLRTSVNPKLCPLDRFSGIVSTAGKRLGISGWSDLGYDGEVTGTVLQAAKSTDQFYTVDIKVETLRIDGATGTCDRERYLRAEICLCNVDLRKNERPCPGDEVRMRGRMVWDGDGFVEIHPRSRDEVRTLSAHHAC